MEKEIVRKTFWENDRYYHLACEGSQDLSHPSIFLLKKYSQGKKRILDLGCGEGSRLNFITNDYNSCIGVDISTKAIRIAKKQFKKCKFIKSDLEKLSFKGDSFDFIFSAFTLEHLSNPEKMINEAIRVLENNGLMLLVAPNFGAPNRASPPANYSRVKKILIGFYNDVRSLFYKSNRLDWQEVEPIKIKSMKNFEIDFDTTIEPYIRTLIDYLVSRNFEIIQSSSLWSEEKFTLFSKQIIFRILGLINVYPFKFWGPHMLIVAKKVNRI